MDNLNYHFGPTFTAIGGPYDGEYVSAKYPIIKLPIYTAFNPPVKEDYNKISTIDICSYYRKEVIIGNTIHWILIYSEVSEDKALEILNGRYGFKTPTTKKEQLGLLNISKNYNIWNSIKE